jgi:hypothetical protein
VEHEDAHRLGLPATVALVLGGIVGTGIVAGLVRRTRRRRDVRRGRAG